VQVEGVVNLSVLEEVVGDLFVLVEGVVGLLKVVEVGD
jgi:hypothetical protein